MLNPVVHVDPTGSARVNAPELRLRGDVGSAFARIVVVGALDIASASAFDVMVDHVLAVGPPRLSVDLAQNTFLAAAGVNALLRAQHRCRQQGGCLRLEHVAPDTHQVLAMLQVDQVIEVEPAGPGPLEPTDVVAGVNGIRRRAM